MERDQRQRATVASDPYANAVIDVLAGDFPDLRKPYAADVIRKHIYANARTQCGLQVIVDDPVSARWRLVPALGDRSRVRLGCWRVNPSDGDREREQRLNAALEAIGH